MMKISCINKKIIINTLIIAIFALSLLIFITETTAETAETADVETKSYILEELGMTINLPSDLIAFTQTIDPEDPNLSLYGYDEKELENNFIKKNIYLKAWDEKKTFNIVIYMETSPETEALSDFNKLTDFELKSMISGSLNNNNNGVTNIKFDTYKHKQAKFIKMNFKAESQGITLYGIQYYTIYDSKTINVMMTFGFDEISEVDEKYALDIISNINFSTEPIINSDSLQASETPGFIFRDPKSDAAFTVPSGWIEDDRSENNEFIDVKIINESGESIMFGSVDMWSAMSAEYKTKHSKSDINNSIFIDESSTITETTGISKNDMSNIIYNGVEYVKIKKNNTDDIFQGLTVSFDITQLICIRDGIAYSFQFTGTEESPGYSDFVNIINSMEYPAEINEDYSLRLDKLSLENILKSFFIAAFLIIIPMLFYRYLTNKEPVKKRKARKIVIIYGIISFLIFISMFARSVDGRREASMLAVLLCIFISYYILIKGRNSQGEGNRRSVPGGSVVKSAAGSSDQAAEEDPFDIIYAKKKKLCKMCGVSVPEDSKYCSGCGAIIK
ncbi:MAG: hypothetical protein K0S55_805 [Clostridia bacterium]|nr:hypothetical protein [Clostridia bacterium]